MKISVIIPTYNGEDTIDRAINSAVCQEGDFDIEILVCDDLSTDNTIERASRFPNVKVFYNNVHTGGPNAGRNLGIKNAKGDYIGFLDQDDEWLPDKLIKQIKEINNGAELVASPSTFKLEQKTRG